MKVLHNTSDKLIVQNNPVWLAVFITVFALVFIAIGLFVMTDNLLLGVVFTGAGLFVGAVFSMVFVRRTQVIFDRPAGLVEMRRRTLRGFTKRSWDLSDLDRVVVETRRTDDASTHRATLVFNGGMDAGEHPVTGAFYSGRGAQRLADAINAWHHDAGKAALLDSAPHSS